MLIIFQDVDVFDDLSHWCVGDYLMAMEKWMRVALLTSARPSSRRKCRSNLLQKGYILQLELTKNPIFFTNFN
jgi:hypothetical protein